MLWFERKYLVHASSNQKSLLHPTYVRFGPFCKFLGDFWVYLGNKQLTVLLKGLVKFMEKENFEDLMFLKLELEV